MDTKPMASNLEASLDDVLKVTADHLNRTSMEFAYAVSKLHTTLPKARMRAVFKLTDPALNELVAEGLVLTARAGESPYDVARRYAAGTITREMAEAALKWWRYKPADTHTDGLHDDLLNFTAGSFDEVEAAFDDGLIDEQLYAAALEGFKLAATA